MEDELSENSSSDDENNILQITRSRLETELKGVSIEFICVAAFVENIDPLFLDNKLTSPHQSLHVHIT